MKKNGMKNFIFSFVVSLLIVFIVNEAFFHEQNTSAKENKIIKPVKNNISLFSQPENAKQESADRSFKNIDDLVASHSIKQKEMSSSETIDIDHAESAKVVYQPEAENNEDVANENVSRDIIKDKNFKHQQFIDLANAQEIVLEKEPAISLTEKNTTKTVVNQPIVYADISDTINDEKIADAANPIIYDNKSEYITVAQKNNDTSTEADIIPIVENNQILHDNVNILTSAEQTQIAMLNPEVLVSSIESIDTPEEKNISEIDLKKEIVSTNPWKQMAESTVEDSPWVVAKGNRFAKNKIAQVDALTEEKNNNQEDFIIEEEIQNVEENSTSQQIATSQDSNNTESKLEVINDKNVKLDLDGTPDSDVTHQADIYTEKNTNNVLTVYDDSGEVKQHIFAKQPSNYLPKTTSSGVKNEEAQTSLLLPKEDTQQANISPKPLLVPSDSSETKLAYKMIQNLIIPLPDDIANDANIIPQLSSEPNKKSSASAKKTEETSKELNKEQKESGLFKNISSWFSKNENADKKDNEIQNPKLSNKNKKKKKGFSLFNDNGDTFDENISYSESDMVEIIPAELKLSFQPNRAEISGHTLRWIHAFADNARDNSNIYIEIRIDGTTSFALQQKRVNLLSSIFANRGVDFRKVNVIFTSREPNSFIIRNIKFNNSEDVVINSEENSRQYQHW